MNKKDFKILVVDDEEIMRDFLTDLLSDQGFSVDKQSSGALVPKALEQNAFDLILTDLRMPDCDGLEVLEKVKNKNCKTKVILMTGYALDNSGQEYLDRGAFGFILKPFDMDQIRNLVLDAFEVAVSENAAQDMQNCRGEEKS